MKLLSKTLLAAGAMLATVGSFSALSAAPLPAPLDQSGVELTLNFGAKAAYNSNVLSSPGGNTKFDDLIFTFTPGFDLEWGRNALTEVKFSFSESFLRYDKHPSLNAELSNVQFDVNRKQGAFGLKGHLDYIQNYNNTPSASSPTLTGIIRYDTIDASGNVHYDLSDKFNFDFGVGFTQNHYLYSIGRAYQDTDTYTLPITGYYVYTPELSFGLGYTYSQTDPHNSSVPFTVGRDRDSHTLDASVVLTKWQKLTGSANVGVTMNHIDGAVGVSSLTTTTVSYGLDLAYAYSEKLDFTLNGGRNFSTGTSGQNIEATSVGLGATYNLTEQIGVQANLLTFTHSEYLQNIPARTDDAYTTGIAVNWRPFNYLTLSTGYTYFMNSSSAPNATYNINVVYVSAAIRY